MIFVTNESPALEQLRSGCGAWPGYEQRLSYGAIAPRRGHRRGQEDNQPFRRLLRFRSFGELRRPRQEGIVTFNIDLEQETDGRWIAEVSDLPGVLAYGQSREDALAHVQALALRVLAEQLEHGETAPDSFSVSFRAA